MPTAEDVDKNASKTEKRNRNRENRRQIIDFIADNEISDSKSVSKAIGLKLSRTRDYLKQLVEEGVLEIEGETLHFSFFHYFILKMERFHSGDEW